MLKDNNKFKKNNNKSSYNNNCTDFDLCTFSVFLISY